MKYLVLSIIVIFINPVKAISQDFNGYLGRNTIILYSPYIAFNVTKKFNKAIYSGHGINVSFKVQNRIFFSIGGDFAITNIKLENINKGLKNQNEFEYYESISKKLLKQDSSSHRDILPNKSSRISFNVGMRYHGKHGIAPLNGYYEYGIFLGFSSTTTDLYRDLLSTNTSYYTKSINNNFETFDITYYGPYLVLGNNMMIGDHIALNYTLELRYPLGENKYLVDHLLAYHNIFRIRFGIGGII